jgi:hypothetical protein
MKKRVVIISDLHSGHRVGLCPPLWQNKSVNPKWNNIQVELWNQYKRMVQTYSPIDNPIHLLIVNGDAIEGKGFRSGSSELITADRQEQCQMAIECIIQWNAKNILMTYGTPYHTGYGEDWEETVALRVGARKIGSQEWPQVNGVTFDCKHFVGNSSIPHGKGTPLAKERLWNVIWNEWEESQPKADIVIRSHVHSFDYVGSVNWLALTTPALQGLGSKYGARIPSKIVHFGIVYFDIEEDGEWSWGYDIVMVETQKAKVLKF